MKDSTNTKTELKETVNRLDSNMLKATADISNVCRTLSLTLFAAVLFNEDSCYSVIVIFTTIVTIFIDLIQYCTTTLLYKKWTKQVGEKKLTADNVEDKEWRYRKVGFAFLGTKVVLVIINLVLVILLLMSRI